MAVGGGPCPVCGLDGDVVVAPGRWGRLRGWMVYGQAPAPTLRCVDGHEWTAGSTGWLTDGGGRSRSWWGWPARVVRVLLDHRTAEPVPRFWLAAGVVGVALGVAVQVTLGWPWWLVTVAWLAVVWLVFLTTALRPLGRDGLWIELVCTVSHTHADDIDRRPAPKWTPTTVLIDGTDRVATTYTEGDDWAAVIDLDQVLVEIQSRGIPTNRISLTQVQDLTPYTEGSIELRNRDRKDRPPT